MHWQRKNFLRWLVALGMAISLLVSLGCSRENPSQLFQQGVDAMDAEKPDEAVIWFKKALQQDPEMALAHYKLGQIYREKKEPKLAFAQFGQAVQQDPKLAMARKEMIFLLVENRALEQVAAVSEQYLDINGDDEEVSIILGNSLAYLGNLDKSVKVFKAAQERYPDSQLVRGSLAKVLVASGEIKEGRSMLEAMALENPDDIGIQIALVQLYEQLERYDLALLLIEVLKEKNPDTPDSYVLQAQMSLKRNRPDQAKEILSDAEEAGIQDAGLFRMHAMILHRQGESAQALKYFKKAAAVATGPSRQIYQLILVDYYSFLQKYKEAQGVLEGVIEEEDSPKGLKSKVVELFLAQGEFDQARTTVDTLLKEDSGDARAHFLKGMMLMQEKDVTGAREQFSKARELAPNAAENQFMYGLTFSDESLDIAITEIGEALKKNPDLLKARKALAALYHKKGLFQDSLEQLDLIIAQEGDDTQTRELRATVYLKMGNPGAALPDAKFLVQRLPQSISDRFRLAEIYFFLKQFDQALPLYVQLREENPENVQVLSRIVAIKMLTEEVGQALALTDSFLTLYPENGAAILLKAKIYLSRGDYNQAERVLVPEANKGQDATASVMLAELYRVTKDAEKVVYYYQQALGISPGNVVVLTKLADFYLGSGRNSEAIVTYEELLKERPDSLVAMNNLAYLYTEGGVDLDRALELANWVARKLPDNGDVSDTLGWIYVVKGVYTQAEPYLQMAVDAKPDNPTVLYHMGMLRFGQKHMVVAEDLLSEAIQKGLQGSELARAQKVLAGLGVSKKKLQEAVSAKDKGDASQAIALFEEILDSDGFRSDAAADLAMLYAEQNKDLEKALALAQKAYAARPADPHIADALGWVYYHQGSLLMAKQYVEQALEKDGDYGPAQVHLGAVYLKKDELEAAQKELELAQGMQLTVADQEQVRKLLAELGER